MTFRVKTAGIREAAQLLTRDPSQFGSVITVGWAPNTDLFDVPRGFEEFRGPKFRAQFNDVRFPDLDGAPTRCDLENLVGFFPQVVCPLLVQCQAGWSRSPAVALVFLAWALGAHCEKEAVESLYRQNEHISPNELVVSLGDRVLRRRRALFDALMEKTGESSPEILGIYDGIRYSDLVPEPR